MKRSRYAAVPVVCALLVSTPWVSVSATSLGHHPQPGELLSEWLLRVHGPVADTTALHWTSRAEAQLQGHLLQHIAATVESGPSLRMSAADRHQLADWFRQLPVTGRLTLVQQAPRALQAQPFQDPAYREGDSFQLYPRPEWVLVINEAGRPCAVNHRAGASVDSYLSACQPSLPALQRADHAWVAQTDGRTQTAGIAPWALTPQVSPAPGAWVWAPSREAGFSKELSDNIARFLATQPPPDQHPLREQFSLAQTTAVDDPSHHGAEGPVHTANDWGEVGYWQTPSARMGPAGAVRAHISRVSPYTRLTTMLQPLEWFELGFRYTSISNRLYGPDIAGSQSLKDKSIDVKFRLRREDATGPELALGLRDLGGTGLFASEYLVASKRWGAWDASLGIGWGNLGSRGNLKNPLSLFGSGYSQRPGREGGQGGTTNFNTLFRGPASLFGGVQWAPHGSPWVFKAEIDGNNYQNEPQSNNQPVKSPINLGLVYRQSPTTAWSLAWERGNRLMLGLTVQGNLGQLHVPKSLDQPLPRFNPQAPAAMPPRGWADVAHEIERYSGWRVVLVSQQHHQATVVAEVDGALYLQDRIDRVTALLHALAPATLTRFDLQLTQRGLPLAQIQVDRTEWALQRGTPVPTASALPAQADYALDSPIPEAVPAQWASAASPWSFNWAPTYDQILGGPDGFILYQLGVAANVQWNLASHTWLSGSLKLGLLDNFDKFKYTAPSDLPRVRTFAREYATASRVTIPRLQLTHVSHLGGNHYGSVYGGLLEPMYGGVGAEWLYRPFKSPWAVGVDLNHVRQREFDQDFSFREYRVNTGHATLHWDTGWNDVHVKLQVGRYLAGDVGATLDLKRTFDNGVAIGAWATKTNVSAAQFGEGSFDKGLYVSIPFDAMLPLSSPGGATLAWTPLTRDGGARLNRSVSLFDLTQSRSPRALRWGSAQPKAARSAENTAYVLQDVPPHPLSDTAATTATLAHQVGGIPGSTWWWAGGAVLASGLLDKRADRWATEHASGAWSTAGSVANATPYALAAGTALLATGVAGEAAASTAQTALRAGAYSIAASFAVRGVLGRSRPQAGQGPGDFAGPSGASLKSSFVSNHTALAFALVTPFAQQHDMPWLYGLAAASAFGRVQKREHWLSDTVGGALLGYGIGSLLSLQHTQSGKGPRIHIAPDSIQAQWTY